MSYTSIITADTPTAYYRMDDTSGTTVHDSSGNGYDATLPASGISYSLPGAIVGDTDTALSFGGLSVLSLPSTLNIASWTGISIEFWISLTTGYQHIVVTSDGTTTLTYLNGFVYAANSGDPVVIDSDLTYAGSYNAGNLDEVAIYNYVLSTTQILRHYTTASPTTDSNTLAETTLYALANNISDTLTSVDVSTLIVSASSTFQSDTITVVETSVSTVSSVSSDISSNTETSVFTIAFIPSETASNTETRLFIISSAVSDTISSLETLASTVSSVSSDIGSSVETDVSTIAFVPSEAASNTETRLFTISLALSDTISSLETFIGATIVSASDALSISETVVNVHLANSTFQDDAVSITENVGQVSAFFVTESLALSETVIVSNIFSLVDDTVFPLEIFALGGGSFSNFLPDSTDLGDIVLAIVQVIQSDSVTLSEAAAFSPVILPSPTILGRDTMIRPNQSGFGTATDGQAYAVVSGSGTLSIASDEAKFTGSTSLTFIRMGSKNSADGEILARVTGSTANITAIGVYLRGTASNTAYRCRLNLNNSSIGLALVRTVAGSSTNLVTTSFVTAINTAYWIRFNVTGSTLLAKAWADGTVEPGWMLTGTDTTITGSGGFGFVASTTSSSDVFLYDNLYAVDYPLGDTNSFVFGESFSAATALSLPSDILSSSDKLVPGNAYFIFDAPITASDTLKNISLYTSVDLQVLFTEQQNFTFISHAVDTVLTTGDFISTISMSTISNISGIDGLSLDDTTSNFTLFTTVIDTVTSSDTFSDTFTFNQQLGSKSIASDTFDRANQSGFGTASDTSTWTAPTGSLAFSITGNTGQVTGTTGTSYTFLGTESTLDGEAQTTFSVTDIVNTQVGVCLRVTDASNLYRYRYSNGTVALIKVSGGTITTITSTAQTIVANTVYRLKFRVVNSLLFGKIWVDGTAEPASWNTTGSDTTFSASGATGYFFSMTAGTATVDNFQVIDYLLADYTPLTEVPLMTGVALESTVFSELSSWGTALAFVPVEILPDAEIYLFALAQVLNDIATVSDIAFSVPSLIWTDSQTSVEIQQYGVTQTQNDSVSLFDASNIFLYTPVDLLNESSSLLALEIYTPTDSVNSSENIDPTLIRIIGDAFSISESNVVGLSSLLSNDLDNLVPNSTYIFAELASFQDALFTLFTSTTSLLFNGPIDIENILDVSKTNDLPLLSDVVLTPIDTVHENIDFAPLESVPTIESLQVLLANAFTFTLSLSEVYGIVGNVLSIYTFTLQEGIVEHLSYVNTFVLTLQDVSQTAESYSAADSLTVTEINRQRINYVPFEIFSFSESISTILAFSATKTYTAQETYVFTLAELETVTSVLVENYAWVVRFHPAEIIPLVEIDAWAFVFPHTDLLTVIDTTSLETVTQFESTLFTLLDTQSFSLALALRSQDSVVEKYITLLTLIDGATLSLSEQRTFAVAAHAIDNISAIVEQFSLAFTLALTQVNTSSDILHSSLALQMLDNTLNVLDIFQKYIVTTFTGWVDVLLPVDISTTILRSTINDILSGQEQSFYAIVQKPIDLLQSQDVFSALQQSSFSERTAFIEKIGIVLSHAESDIAGLSEINVLSIQSKTIDALAASEGYNTLLAQRLQDTLTQIERIMLREAQQFSVIPLTVSETDHTNNLFVPIEQFSIKDMFALASSLAFLDQTLTLAEYLSLLGYGLFDLPLSVNDTVVNSYYHFMNVVSVIRSGQVNATVRSGRVNATVRSGKPT